MSVVARTDDAVEWLLQSDHPAIRRLTTLRLLGRGLRDPDVQQLDLALLQDSWVAALLEGERHETLHGPMRAHPYRKWGGGHWRLISLAELDVPADDPEIAAAVRAAFDETAAWLLSPGRVARADRQIRGRSRICGSQNGAAIWAASRLGLAGDERVGTLVEHLLRWQWPDGGWNCDKRPEATHASFNESWMPLRGLAAFRAAQGAAGTTPPGDRVVAGSLDATIDGAAEFLLRHRVVESERTGEVAHPRLLELRWPPYWHYGLLPGLLALDAAGRLDDPRVAPAFDRLRELRGVDGRWHPTGRWWGGPGSKGSNVEIVAWGRAGETAMLTIGALSVLGAVAA